MIDADDFHFGIGLFFACMMLFFTVVSTVRAEAAFTCVCAAGAAVGFVLVGIAISEEI